MMMKEQVCRQCKGLGHCMHCDGRGYVRCYLCDQGRACECGCRCSACKGTGRKTCYECEGTGLCSECMRSEILARIEWREGDREW
jgi:hypothetical protein